MTVSRYRYRCSVTDPLWLQYCPRGANIHFLNRFEEASFWQRRSSLEKKLIGLVLVFVLVIIGLLLAVVLLEVRNSADPVERTDDETGECFL